MTERIIKTVAPQVPDATTEDQRLPATTAQQKLAGIIEVKLGELNDPRQRPRISIPLTTLTGCVPADADLNTLIIDTAREYGLGASGRVGDQGLEVVLYPLPHGHRDGGSKPAAVPPSLQALSLLVEANRGTLSKDRWNQALNDRAVFNEIIIALDPQIKLICGGVAKKHGISFSPSLISNAQLAALRLLPSYDPTKSTLSSYLDNYLPYRMIDELRAESRDRPQRAFAKRVEVAKNTLEQRLARAVADHDPAVAEELGIPWQKYIELTRRYLATRGQVTGADEQRIARLEDISSRVHREPIELREIIAQLPIRERKLLALAEAGYQQKEIAEIFGVSGAWVSLALSSLERQLSGEAPARSRRGDSSFGLGFAVLDREVQVTGKTITSWSDLRDYIDGLSFFSQLKISKSPFAIEFKKQYCAPDGSFLYSSLPPESQQAISGTIKLLSPTIDHLHFHHFFLDLFDLPRPSVPVDRIARQCVENGILSGARPPGHPFCMSEVGGRRSRFFEDSVVSSQIVESNVISLMRELYPDPDSIRREIAGTGGLLELLGFGGSKGELAKWGLDHGVWPREWPPGHSIYKVSTNTPSVLLQPQINGQEAASQCLAAAFLEAFPHIDAVTRHGLFSVLLQAGEPAEQLAQAAIGAGIPIPLHRPAGYALGRLNVARHRELAFFYRPDIVGFETARANTKAFVEELLIEPSDLRSRMVARALNATRLPSEPTVSETQFDAQALRTAIISRGWPAPLPYQSRRRQTIAT